MSAEPTPGVYRHYKSGADGKPRYYLLLWKGVLEEDVTTADVDLGVSIDSGKIRVVATPGQMDYDDWHSPLCVARAHGPMKALTRVCVYVPLYADKPGRRISVRPLVEWIERVGAVPRFDYVGETVPRG